MLKIKRLGYLGDTNEKKKQLLLFDLVVTGVENRRLKEKNYRTENKSIYQLKCNNCYTSIPLLNLVNTDNTRCTFSVGLVIYKYYVWRRLP